MNERELVAVFWATCAAVCLIWGVATLVRIGVDQQERAERRQLLDECIRLGDSLDPEERDRAIEEVLGPDVFRSITAPQKADSPSEQPTQQGLR